MSQRKLATALRSGRYLRFKYRKAGDSNPQPRYVLPRDIRNDLLVAYEYTPDNRHEGKQKNFRINLIDNLTVMPEHWSPDLEWRERKIVDGDMVIEDVTTLRDRRNGCAAKSEIRLRRRGILRWIFGD